MNILVTGANGQLGTEMRDLARSSCHKFIFTDVNSVPGAETLPLDITDAAAVSQAVRDGGVDVIVNCAAYTNVDKAEDCPELAGLLNAGAAGILASAAKDSGATLVHISTDYVFHGDSHVPYREDDPKNPLGVYGKTKLAGEEAIISSGCKYIIFRTAWLYSPYGNNFVKTVRRITSERDSAGFVFDQVGTPTYAADLAALIMHLVDSGQLHKTGVYHFSNEGVISWYDFAVQIRDLSGNSCAIKPIHTSEYPSRASRPHFSVLDKTKVKETFGVSIPYWRDSLEKCIEILKENGI